MFLDHFAEAVGFGAMLGEVVTRTRLILSLDCELCGKCFSRRSSDLGAVTPAYAYRSSLDTPALVKLASGVFEVGNCFSFRCGAVNFAYAPRSLFWVH